MELQHIFLSVFLFVNVVSNCMGQNFTITTILEDPYTMIKRGADELQLEGYIPDLIHLLSERLGFTYRFKLVPDGKYGAISEDGTWNGMIGEVMREEADIAAASLTITNEREAVVDFTKPYMNLGITGLVRRPTWGEEGRVNTTEELAESENVRYGFIAGGSTMKFFRDSTDPVIQRLWEKLEETPDSYLCRRMRDCIDEVRRGDYIFFGESTMIDYTIRRECDLTQFGGLLEGSIKGYGLAMREGDSFVDELNEELLRLQEDQDLQILYNRWWQQGGTCNT